MKAKIEALLKKIINEGQLVLGRLSVDSLLRAWQDGRAVFIEDEKNKEIVSCGVLWFHGNSVEIGSMWTDRAHRGNGKASEVFSRLISIAPKNIGLFAIANNPSIARLAIDNNMIEINRENWTKAVLCPDCSLCTRLSAPDRDKCSLKNFKEGRRVFIVFLQEGELL